MKIIMTSCCDPRHGWPLTTHCNESWLKFYKTIVHFTNDNVTSEKLSLSESTTSQSDSRSQPTKIDTRNII